MTWGHAGQISGLPHLSTTVLKFPTWSRRSATSSVWKILWSCVTCNSSETLVVRKNKGRTTAQGPVQSKIKRAKLANGSERSRQDVCAATPGNGGGAFFLTLRLANVLRHATPTRWPDSPAMSGRWRPVRSRRALGMPEARSVVVEGLSGAGTARTVSATWRAGTPQVLSAPRDQRQRTQFI